MNQHAHRRYSPYHSRGFEELKVSPRRTKRKHVYVKPSDCSKVFAEKCKKKSSPQSTSPTKVGKYILSEVNSATCLCQAVHIDSRKEYSCRVVEIGKYKEIVTPYYSTNYHEHINKIEEILLGDQFAYIMFEKSFGDLHSYIRCKKKLKEEEASRLFKQIVSVVKHCHSAGLVLRDLKLRKFVFKDKAR